MKRAHKSKQSRRQIYNPVIVRYQCIFRDAVGIGACRLLIRARFAYYLTTQRKVVLVWLKKILI